MNNFSAEIDRIIKNEIREGSPGCSVAVIKDSKICYMKSFGLANLEHEIPVKNDTVFHTASISKQFTAIAIHLLEIEGKLSIEDDIRKYLPELPVFDQTITLDHLIHHTSGLRDQWDLLQLAGWRLEDIITNDDILELVKQQKELNFPPGTEHMYCSTGYTILTYIIERIENISFKTFCENRFFKPLNMASTHFNDDFKNIIKNQAQSYISKNNIYENSPMLFSTVGGTGLKTTIEDLALWELAFADNSFFSEELLSKIYTPGKLTSGKDINYGSGLVLSKYKGQKVIRHNGCDAGFRAHMLRFPELELSVYILSNFGSIRPGGLVQQIAETCSPDDFNTSGSSTDRSETITLPIDQLKEKTGVYYDPETAFSLTLKIIDDKLYIHYPYGAESELKPISNGQFQMEDMPSFKFSFENDNLYHYIGGNKAATYIKSDPLSRRIEKLNEFTGSYLSPEMDIIYKVLLEDNTLYLKRMKYGKRKLIPSGKDGFIGEVDHDTIHMGILGMEFFRKDNIVQGFRVTTRDIRNLLFVKQQ